VAASRSNGRRRGIAATYSLQGVVKEGKVTRSTLTKRSACVTRHDDVSETLRVSTYSRCRDDRARKSINRAARETNRGFIFLSSLFPAHHPYGWPRGLYR